MGQTSETVKLLYLTYVVHDRIKVYYQGSMIADTGCQATGYGTPAWAQTVQFSGSSSQLKVRVDSNCAGGTDTQWTYNLSCP